MLNSFGQSGSTHSNTGGSSSARSTAAAKRRQERERQMAGMDALIGQKSTRAPAGGAFDENAGESSADEQSDQSAMTNTSGSEPPRGAIENARKFLWEDDEDEDDLEASQASNSFADAGSEAPSSLHGGGGSGLGLFGRLRGNNKEASLRGGDDEENASFSDSQSGGGLLGGFRNAFGARKRDSSGDAFRGNMAPRRDSVAMPAKRRESFEEEYGDADPWWIQYQEGFGERMSQDYGIRRKCVLITCVAALIMVILVKTRHSIPFLNTDSLAPPPKHPSETVNSGSASSPKIDIGVSQGDKSAAGNDNLAMDDKEMASDEPTDVRYVVLRQRILDAELSLASEMTLENSPQYLALRWITYHDTGTDAEDPYALQRYALAVFFFATYYPAALLGQPLEAVAQYFADEGDGGTVPGGWKRVDHWLNPKKGYCLWYGVECSPDPSLDPGITHFDGNRPVIGLNLTDNNVQGYLPYEVSGFSALHLLDLGQNRMADYIPSTLGLLTHLRSVYLSDNDFSGTLSTELGRLTSATHLYLSDNMLTGPIPSEFGKLTSLQALGMYSNYLKGPIPDSLGDLTELEVMYLDDNDLTGPIPSSLGKLENVRDLRLSLNALEGKIPTQLGQLAMMEDLYLDRNALTGPIPSTIGNCHHLAELHLFQNKLTDTLPTSMQALSNLVTLYLDHNSLSGTLHPDIFTGLRTVESLYLNSNSLSGSLPSTMGEMEHLLRLRLYENAFVGTIPTELGGIFKLQDAFLQDNNLEGSIPEALGDLKSLKKLLVNNNNLKGTVPNAVCLLAESHDLEDFHSDCNGDLPKVECRCCTQCFD